MAKRQPETGPDGQPDSPPGGQPNEQPDEQLLSAFAGGDAAALGALAERHERALIGLAVGVLGSEELAKEAVQEAWVRVIRHAGTFKGRSSFKTWMYRIVINRCKDIREKEGRSGGRGMTASRSGGQEQEVSAKGAGQLASETQLGSGSSMAVAELNGTLRRAVDELEERKRMAVLVCYHEGITHEAAAEILGVPLGTLKSRLNAALKELRVEMGEMGASHGQEGLENKR